MVYISMGEWLNRFIATECMTGYIMHDIGSPMSFLSEGLGI